MRRDERMRRAARALLPTRLFTAVSTAADYAAACRALPLSEARLLIRVLRAGDEATVAPAVAFRAGVLEHPFFIRSRYSDARSFMGTCIRSEYGPLLPVTPPEFVVDAGAFTGDCSALILTRFPEAHIFALEPQRDAFELAARNLQPYGPDAKVRNAALWFMEDQLKLSGTGIGATVSGGVEDADVDAMSMNAVLREAGFLRIDLFKCDIEGAEVEVFSRGDLGWLDVTDRILIELHSPDAARVVKGACSEAGLEYHGQYRSTHVFQRPGGDSR